MPRIAEEDARRFAVAVLTESGLGQEDAEKTAEGLLDATKRGVATHGLFRLPQYSDSLRAGKINSTPNVRVLSRRGVTALVDADGGYGFRPSYMAIDLAVEIARENGVGLVGVRNSHHFGAAATYTRRAAEQGCIGITTTTTRALIAPTGAKGPVVGNNPMSFAVPRRPPHKPVVLDMALSQVAMGRVRVAAADGKSVPEGWGYDSEGRPTTDPKAIMNGGLLAAIGGYKGYGLSVIVELLAGALTGSRFGLDADNHAHPKGGTGHFNLAIAPDFLRPIDEFYVDVDKLVGQIKSSPKAQGAQVYVPGEIEDEKAEAADREGLPASEELVSQLRSLAEKLAIEAPRWKT